MSANASTPVTRQVGMGWMRRANCARYTALPWTADPDQVTPAQRVWLEAICDSCPSRQDCNAYAGTAHIVGGFWAGRWRRLPLPRQVRHDRRWEAA